MNEHPAHVSCPVDPSHVLLFDRTHGIVCADCGVSLKGLRLLIAQVTVCAIPVRRTER